MNLPFDTENILKFLFNFLKAYGVPEPTCNFVMEIARAYMKNPQTQPATAQFYLLEDRWGQLCAYCAKCKVPLFQLEEKIDNKPTLYTCTICGSIIAAKDIFIAKIIKEAPIDTGKGGA